MPIRKFDPRLKAAMQEIKDVLNRYDIAGQVVLVSPTHSEFHTHFPTWSLAQFETDAKGEEIGISFKTGGQIFATPKSKHQAAEVSVHILAQFQHNAAVHFTMADELLEMLKEPLGIETKLDPPEPHTLAGELAAFDPKNQARPRRRGWAL
jgi:hypothetical protein